MKVINVEVFSIEELVFKAKCEVHADMTSNEIAKSGMEIMDYYLLITLQSKTDLKNKIILKLMILLKALSIVIC